MPIPNAVLFDCDGVLVDSEPHSVTAWLDVLDRLGHPATAADVAACTGLGFVPTREELVVIAPLPPPEELWPELLAALERSFGRGLRVFEDGMALLGEVRRRGLRHAVVSGSPRSRLELTLEAAGLSFDVLVAGDDVGAGKPSPDPYLAAAAHLGVDAEDCLVIEDTPTGVRSGRAAGMQVVAVARNPGDAAALSAAGAHDVVATLDISDVLGRGSSR